MAILCAVMSLLLLSNPVNTLFEYIIIMIAICGVSSIFLLYLSRILSAQVVSE